MFVRGKLRSKKCHSGNCPWTMGTYSLTICLIENVSDTLLETDFAEGQLLEILRFYLCALACHLVCNVGNKYCFWNQRCYLESLPHKYLDNLLLTSCSCFSFRLELLLETINPSSLYRTIPWLSLFRRNKPINLQTIPSSYEPIGHLIQRPPSWSKIRFSSLHNNWNICVGCINFFLEQILLLVRIKLGI